MVWGGGGTVVRYLESQRLKDPSLHDVEQCVGLRLVQGHKGRHGILD